MIKEEVTAVNNIESSPFFKNRTSAEDIEILDSVNDLDSKDHFFYIRKSSQGNGTTLVMLSCKPSKILANSYSLNFIRIVFTDFSLLDEISKNIVSLLENNNIPSTSLFGRLTCFLKFQEALITPSNRSNQTEEGVKTIEDNMVLIKDRYLEKFVGWHKDAIKAISQSPKDLLSLTSVLAKLDYRLAEMLIQKNSEVFEKNLNFKVFLDLLRNLNKYRIKSSFLLNGHIRVYNPKTEKMEKDLEIIFNKALKTDNFINGIDLYCFSEIDPVCFCRMFKINSLVDAFNNPKFSSKMLTLIRQYPQHFSDLRTEISEKIKTSERPLVTYLEQAVKVLNEYEQKESVKQDPVNVMALT